ncbi:MAG: NAD(P)-dependent dehydrogenase (short-subunit alcohol dehydrogenase family) [Glaciecola sp.]|jgi:NAD(P)-dependent dehydrogenase (short-subunit alcohol dehydrogenase family)
MIEPSPTGQFEGRVAIVTGGASGIGRAVATRLRRGGARVVVVDRDEVENDPADLALRADVTVDEACADAVTTTVDRFGRLDILVNSAGRQCYGDVTTTSEQAWDDSMAVNVKSMFLMSRHAVPHLIASGAGSIVHVSSVQGLAAQRGVVAYAASKGAVLALTQAMACDHAPEVRVNAVCPGSVDTPMLRASASQFFEDADDAMQSWGAMHPVGRVAQPAEVAEAICFLASPAASFITGTILRVDGGLLSQIPGI